MTTSLQRPYSGRRLTETRVNVNVEPVTEGVPRSAWMLNSRASTWHGPYVLLLLAFDYMAALIASVLTVSVISRFSDLIDTPAAGFYVVRDGVSSISPMFYIVAYWLLPLTWVLVLWGNGAYDRRYLGIGTDEFKRVVRSAAIIVSVVAILTVFTKTNVSRAALFTALGVAFINISLLRFGARRVLHSLRAKGRAIQRMLLVGAYPDTIEVHNAVTRTTYAGMVPVGIYLTEGAASVRGLETPVPIFSNRDVVELAADLDADTIAVCGSASTEPGELRRLAWQLEGTGRDLVVAPQLTDIAGPRVHIRPVEGLPLLHVEEPTLSGLSWLVKNVLDRITAAVGLLLLTPVLAAIAIYIKATSPGPVFFRQPRVGMEGRTFHCWKFRTMYIDAEERQAALMMQNESDGLLFKIKDDPRVTSAGKFLRKTSLDELPQLINVLKGEMSLVGPRPLPADNGDFLGDVRRRLLVRPGITGLWQVSGRSDLSWDDAVRLDLFYVDNWSLTTDLQILLRTIAVVLRRRGAY
ncbi:exopolysaccharide biosynthesis polyprenyl glycosylphosphotransferase [Stackebrandtia nassauensis DSM 44728]|uniref:Exopolysaccharide biosynthesis polyprenyl glycosylphosphotransferase n=2 Tax=Stackebrandtia TaxID=283810 RepID=D3Q5E3_STANL|nr:sugar transferase [Stackebrandtia nassauensis]ADD46003.1 exopolysaccharide biosynthesis polyprenyl glycosylphosphotransferase [Stackebrandtia nassauensis DSM 44728]